MSAYDPFDSVLDNPYLKYLKNNKNSEEYYSQEYDEHYTKIYEKCKEIIARLVVQQ